MRTEVRAEILKYIKFCEIKAVNRQAYRLRAFDIEET